MSSHDTLVYRRQGGKEMVVDAGGLITIMPGGQIQSPNGTPLVNGKQYQTKAVADLSAEATYYMVARYAGLITNLSSIIDGAIQTADCTATFSINGVAVTGGVLTMPVAASAAGAKASAAPTGANTVAIGDVISFVVTGDGSGGSPRGEITVEITAQ